MMGRRSRADTPCTFVEVFLSVIAGHSRSKNGVALLAYAPAIHPSLKDGHAGQARV
jgi:hypothetical protein